MSKILLLNPPAPSLFIRDYYCSFESKADYYWPPQDLLALSGLLSKGNDIYVIDGIFDKRSSDDISSFINENGIDILFFTTGTATLLYDKKILSEIKEKTGVFTVVSSGILKYYAEEFFKKLSFIDAAILDFTDPEIREFVENPYRKKWNTIWVKKGDELEEPLNVFKRTFFYDPPLHELFPYDKYSIPIAKKNPFAVVIASMGCPYKCRFCTVANYGVKFREIENTIQELKKLKLLGFKEILFQDPTLTVNTKFLNSLLTRMIEENLNFSFSCNADINSMNEEKIVLLKKAGCHTVNIGLESGDDRILKLYNKQLNTKKAIEVVKLFKKHRIRTLGYFIIGLPGETEDTIEKTIEFSKSLDLDFASFAIATPDVGSDLRREAIEKGWIKGDMDFFDSTDNPILDLPDLPMEKIKKLRNRAEREFYLRPKYILKRLTQILSFREFITTLKNGFVIIKRIILRK